MKSPHPPKSLSFLFVLVAALFALTLAAYGQTERVLYSFQGGSLDGAAPYPGLVTDSAGNLYGATTDGGPGNLGVVFELSPPSSLGGAWTETVLHFFQGAPSDGSSSWASLTIDRSGNLYGTTAGGGTFDSGTVFQLTPPASPGGSWTESVLYSFQGGSDGDQPWNGSLVLDSGGAIYGVTRSGGASNNGTVFQLVPPSSPGGTWTENVLHSFAGGTDGSSPVGGLVFGRAGVLYGTTSVSTKNRGGTVFAIAPPSSPGGDWTEKVIYHFQGGSDGASAQCNLVFDSQGNLYGTTDLGGSQGAGTVFKLTAASGAPWTHTVLYNFGFDTVGAYPVAGVTFDHAGNLYGTTSFAGVSNNGTVYKLSPPSTSGGAWTTSLVYDFQDRPDAEEPFAGVVFGWGNALYGTAPSGGENGLGAVFGIRP